LLKDQYTLKDKISNHYKKKGKTIQAHTVIK